MSFVQDFYLFCANHTLLRPITSVLRFLEAISITLQTRQRLLKKVHGDPGLPVPNPTSSYWQQPPDKDLKTIKSPELPKKANVVIIGSGITAASTAFHILSKQKDISVVIVEARTITSGATGRNGGHIVEVPYEDYQNQIDLLGKEAAKAIIRFRLNHLPEILHFAESELSVEARAESEIRMVEVVNAIFDEEEWSRTKENLNKFLEDFVDQRDKWRAYEEKELHEKFNVNNAYGAIVGPSGAIWPYRFVTSVYRKLLREYPARFWIETETPVTEVKLANTKSEVPYIISTPRGEIKTEKIVHATNGYAGHLVPSMQGRLIPLRGQMTVQELPGCKNEGHHRSWLLKYGKGFDYLTQNAHSGLYFLGGGTFQGDQNGESDIGNASDAQENMLAIAHLNGLLPRVFGEQEVSSGATIRSSWTGVMGFSSDGLPWIGRIPNSITKRRISSEAESRSGEFIAAGFCGSGMVYCWGSGRALADSVLGNELDWFPQALLITEQRYKRAAPGNIVNYWLSLTNSTK